MLVAIPFYSNVPFLRETLRSLQAQTDAHFEAVVLDDSIGEGEADGARTAVESLADARFRYSRNERNLGLGGNWNQGLDLAENGPWDLVVLLHADDRLMPDYVRRVRKEFRDHPEAESVFVHARVINESGMPAFSLPDRVKEWIRPRGKRIELRGVQGVGALIPGDFIFCPSICYRVSALRGRRFDPTRRQVLDFEWVVRSLLSGGVWIGLYDQVLFEYRRHSRNATLLQSENFSRFLEEIAFYRELSRELTSRGELRLARRARQMWIVRLNLGVEVLRAFLGLRIRRVWKGLAVLRLTF